jgi:ubiquinol-cytochrome c reductase cytochrome b subunit
MWKKIKDWLEVRIGLDELVRSQLTGYNVPANINYFYSLGFVALFAFVIQALSGFFLLIYYIPHSDKAFRSVQDIMTVVPYGWLFRLIHVVGSNLMMAVVILHIASVFFMGSYKKPRELTWVAGGLLFFTTIGFCLSGYLLPWSQLSYWATTIVTTIPTAFPYVGDYVAEVLRGGNSVSGVTLNRFFALHVALLPPIFALIAGAHLFLIRRIGISAPPFGKPAEEEKPWTEYKHDSHPNGIPFYPNFIIKEASAVMIFLAVIFLITTFAPMLFLPADANTPADPLKTPAHIKPEWYFLAAYQMLRIIPNRFLGISLQLIIVAIFLLWPFFDSKEEKNIMKRPVLRWVFLATVIAWFTLTIWGKNS